MKGIKANILKSLSKYKGKHLVIIKNKIFTAQTGQEAVRIFKKVVKEYPNDKPTLTYIPKEETLIVYSCFNGS